MKLDVVVTQNARTWCLASQICRDKRSNDCRFKILFKVQDVIGNSELRGHTASVPEIVQRTAPSVVAPELHRETDDLLSALLQQSGGCGRIHAAAHRNSNHLQ